MKKNVFTTDDVKIHEQHNVYQGYFAIEQYTLQHKLYKGDWSKPFQREVFERADAVAVLLYDPILDNVVLIEQFRIGALGKTNHPWLLELVAGIIEPDETPEKVALREVKEETNLDPAELQMIYKYFVSPGGSTEKVYLFWAKVDSSKANGIHGLASEQEDIKVVVLKREEAFNLLETNQISNAITIIGLQWLQNHLCT